jgi:hypothetical protein
MENSGPPSPPLTDSIPPTPSTRRRAWIWFFAVLAALTLTAIVLQVWYNNHIELTPERLALARSLWRANEPANYDMRYVIRKLDSIETYDVQVRNGKAVKVICNGQPLEERLFHYSEMPALFGYMDDFLEQDLRPGRPRTLAKATFDASDGHLLHYVRSVASKRERQEITVVHFDRL